MFDLIKNKPIIRVESLTVPEMLELWESDPSEEKRIANQKLTYIYHMGHPKSPYAKMSIDRKAAEVKKDFLDPFNIEIDTTLIHALDKYIASLDNAGLRWVRAAEQQLDKMAFVLEHTEPVFGKGGNITDILRALNQGKETLKGYKDLVKIAEEIEDDHSDVRRGARPNMFDTD